MFEQVWNHSVLQQDTQLWPWSQDLEKKKDRDRSAIRAVLVKLAPSPAGDTGGYLLKDRHLGPELQRPDEGALSLALKGASTFYALWSKGVGTWPSARGSRPQIPQAQKHRTLQGGQEKS